MLLATSWPAKVTVTGLQVARPQKLLPVNVTVLNGPPPVGSMTNPGTAAAAGGDVPTIAAMADTAAQAIIAEHLTLNWTLLPLRWFETFAERVSSEPEPTSERTRRRPS